MTRTADLQIIQYRPQMFFATRHLRRYVPLSVLLGFACWEGGIRFYLSGGGWILVSMCALASLVCFATVPWILLHGVSLSIDQMRGWIHYHLVGLGGHTQESFSPMRIDSLCVNRRGLFSGRLGWWELHLRLDHPRLTNVCLMKSFNLREIERVAGDLSAMLEIDWYDAHKGRHRDDPLTMDVIPDPLNSNRNVMPPPPEIEIHARQGYPTLVFPHSGILTRGMIMFLLYALVWCVWAWTSLSLEWRILDVMAHWHSRQILMLTLLGLAVVIGGAMLVRSLYGMLAQEELQATEGGWVLTRRWLGLSMGRQLLSPLGIKGMRRIEPPNQQVGLWIGNGQGEVRLGAGLSVEALFWVQAMMRSDPQALRAGRPGRMSSSENAVSEVPESGPGRSTPPNALTSG